jgi:hypothetical protein
MGRSMEEERVTDRANMIMFILCMHGNARMKPFTVKNLICANKNKK